LVDELDLVDDTTGLAAFLKNYTNRFIKFFLIGIGHNISSLISDHRSIQTKLDPVKLNVMDEWELNLIIDKVVDRLNLNGILVEFDKRAKKYLVKLADGFPWYVHVVGQKSLAEAYDQKRLSVYEYDVEVAIRKVLAGKLYHQFSELYLKAVCKSPKRETVLRLLARYNDEIIPLSVIYSLAKELNVKDPYSCKRQLMDERCGKVLVTPGIHSSPTVMFSNQMFKRYVNLRESFHSKIKIEVEAKWAETFQKELV
jgi:hypothetical protein